MAIEPPYSMIESMLGHGKGSAPRAGPAGKNAKNLAVYSHLRAVL